jgi:hypothetical protein
MYYSLTILATMALTTLAMPTSSLFPRQTAPAQCGIFETGCALSDALYCADYLNSIPDTECAV